MTVYIDKLRYYPPGTVNFKGASHWCHMWTDGDIDELHRFAARIGMRYEWFQKHRVLNHYDLIARRRNAAIKAGAVECDVKDFLRDQRIANVS